MYRLLAPLMCGAYFLVACGTSGGNATPAPTATASPSSTTITQSFIAYSGEIIPLPAINGESGGTLTLPTILYGAGGKANVTVTMTGLQTPATTQSTSRGTLSNIIVYEWATYAYSPQTPQVVQGQIEVAFSWPNGFPTFFSVFTDPTGKQTQSATLAPTSDGTYTADSPDGTYTFAGATAALIPSAYFQLYSIPPTPAPTPTPAPLSVTPSSLSFTSAGQTATLSVSDPNVSAVPAVSGCTGIASAGAVTNGSLTVTAVAAGTCQLTITDALKRSVAVPVTVTTLAVPVN